MEKDKTVTTAAAVQDTAADAAKAIVATASDAAGDVRVTAEKVAHAVEELASLTSLLSEEQAKQIRKLQITTRVIIVIICLKLVLSAFMGYAIFRISENTKNIDEIRHQTEQLR